MFIDDFSDMMSDTVTIIPGVRDEYGDFIASGSTTAARCYIEGATRMVRTVDNREVVSTLQIFLDGFYGLSLDRHKFQLPARYMPNAPREALSIQKSIDEDGPQFEVVML